LKPRPALREPAAVGEGQDDAVALPLNRDERALLGAARSDELRVGAHRDPAPVVRRRALRSAHQRGAEPLDHIVARGVIQRVLGDGSHRRPALQPPCSAPSSFPAGTELPLLLRRSDLLRVPLLDTTAIHVDSAIERLLIGLNRSDAFIVVRVAVGVPEPPMT
jgi:hypothetical protein